MKKGIDFLEMSIISCVLIKPDLMERIRFKDEYIKHYRNTWQFMKAFYKKFGNFDMQLMYSIIKNPVIIETLTAKFCNLDFSLGNFELYQDRLIEEYAETPKNLYIINTSYKLANDLLTRNISVTDFKEKIDELYQKSEIYFKNTSNSPLDPSSKPEI